MSTNLKIRQLLGPLLRSATTRRNLFRDLRSAVRNLGVSAAQRRVTDECATPCVTDSPNSLPLVPRVWYPCKSSRPADTRACLHTSTTREPLKTKHITVTTDTDGGALRSSSAPRSRCP